MDSGPKDQSFQARRPGYYRLQINISMGGGYDCCNIIPSAEIRPGEKDDEEEEEEE